jgi:hypothetical protein
MAVIEKFSSSTRLTVLPACCCTQSSIAFCIPRWFISVVGGQVVFECAPYSMASAGMAEQFFELAASSR